MKKIFILCSFLIIILSSLAAAPLPISTSIKKEKISVPPIEIHLNEAIAQKDLITWIIQFIGFGVIIVLGGIQFKQILKAQKENHRLDIQIDTYEKIANQLDRISMAVGAGAKIATYLGTYEEKEIPLSLIVSEKFTNEIRNDWTSLTEGILNINSLLYSVEIIYPNNDFRSKFEQARIQLNETFKKFFDELLDLRLKVKATALFDINKAKSTGSAYAKACANVIPLLRELKTDAEKYLLREIFPLK